MKISKKAKREAKQLFRLCLVNGSLDENRVRQVVQRVVATGTGCPAMLAHFLRLVKLDRAQHTAKVESATPLPPELQAIVQAGLARPVRRGLDHYFRPAPGVDRRDANSGGSDVYDGSVLAGLEALEKSF